MQLSKNQVNRMSLGSFFKDTLKMIKINIKEIILIGIIFSIPTILLGSNNFVTSFISLLSSVVGVLTVMVIIDRRVKGTDINIKDAVKIIIRNPYVPIMVFIAKNILTNLGYMVTPILGQVVVIFLFASLPYAVLENYSVIDSIKVSVNLVKNNFLDILLKKLCMMLVINLIVMLVSGFLVSNILWSAFIVLFNIIMIVPDLVIYYNTKS